MYHIISSDLRLRVYRYDVCYRSVLINFRAKRCSSLNERKRKVLRMYIKVIRFSFVKSKTKIRYYTQNN